MKFLRLILSRLTLYYQKNTLIFFMFFLGGVASMLGFLYFWGNMLPSVRWRSDRTGGFREYTLSSDRSYETEELQELFAATSLFSGVTVENISEKGRIQASLFGEIAVYPTIGDASFAGEDTFSVIAPDNARLMVGDSATIGGEIFTVTGKHSQEDAYYIPYAAFEKLELSVNGLILYSAEREPEKKDKAYAFLQENFPGAAIETPHIWNSFDATDSYATALQLTVSYGAVMLAFLFLFLHMIEETADMTAVCRIVGADGRKIGAMHLCEILLLTASTGITGILLHILLYRPVFSKIDLLQGVNYRAIDYALALILTLADVLLFSIPFLWKGIRASPIDAYRRASH